MELQKKEEEQGLLHENTSKQQPETVKLEAVKNKEVYLTCRELAVGKKKRGGKNVSFLALIL